MNARDLVAELRRRGVEITPEPGGMLRLRGTGPRLPDDLREAVRQHKPEVIAILTAGEAPLAAGDGCTAHAVTAEDAARWWAAAEGRAADVGWCTCCHGPARAGALWCRRCQPSPLADLAAGLAPAVRFSLRETADVAGDIALLRRVRRVIAEHEPGHNLIVLTVQALDGRRRRVYWRALACRELRIGIARALASHAVGIESIFEAAP